MKTIRAVFRIACIFSVLVSYALAERETMHELSPAAKETLRIVTVEEFESIKINGNNLDEIFEKVKARLVQMGVKVRLRKFGRREKIDCDLNYVHMPMIKLLEIFNDFFAWGWIVYDDGSITFFDSVCACNYPKNGIHYHESQYQAGSPANMKNEIEEEPNH